MTAALPHAPTLHRARRISLIIAAVGIVAGGIGWAVSPEAFYRAYLHGWLLWLGVSLGSMGLTLIFHLLSSAWGAAIRRPAEAAAMMLPLLAVLFAPIAIGTWMGALFPWSHAGIWRADPVMAHRHAYLNVPFFLARAGIYGICWIGIATLLWRGSRRLDDPSLAETSMPGAVSGPALMLYLLTMGLFASTDWMLALEPHYKSTVFGLIIVAGQGVTALCVLIPTLILIHRAARPAVLIDADTWNDLASVLLTAIMLWGYLEVCQFIINWMGNTQDGNRWYLQRLSHGWGVLSGLLVLFHVALPGLLLLFRRVKRCVFALGAVCILLLLCRGIYGFWMINPSGADPMPMLSARFSWLDIVLPVAVGGIWMAGFTSLLARVPVVVRSEPLPTEGAYVR